MKYKGQTTLTQAVSIMYNRTKVDMKIHLTSWGNYAMYISGTYNSRHKFQEVETIKSGNTLIFYKEVGENSDLAVLSASLTIPWLYITTIECDGVSVPPSYFTQSDNWKNAIHYQINGTYSHWVLAITSELLNNFSQ